MSQRTIGLIRGVVVTTVRLTFTGENIYLYWGLSVDNNSWLNVCPDGWKTIVNKADAMLKFVEPDYQIAQIKEKFGTLRYYIHSSVAEEVKGNLMNAITSWAETRSQHTCMECGMFGKLRDDNHWIVTLCDICNVKRNEQIAAEKFGGRNKVVDKQPIP